MKTNRGPTKLTSRGMVPLRLLKAAPWNPPKRTTPNKLLELRDSMDLLGLLSPIVITKSNYIIDGHRRAACARLLGWENIECNIVEEHTPESVFSSVNTVSRSLSGNDAFVVFLKNEQACPPKVRRLLTRMESLIGRRKMEDLCERGRSPSIVETAVRICKYPDRSGDEHLKNVLLWMDKHNVGSIARRFVDLGLDPTKLARAIDSDKPIKLKLEVSAG